MSSRILIVDDEANIRSSFVSLLSDEGHSAAAAASAEEAQAALGKRTFDLVLLDIQLPGMSGLELLERLRNDPLAPVVLVISGQAEIADALKAVRLGALDFLEKPVTPEKLLSAVTAALSFRAANRQRSQLIDDMDERHRMVGESRAMMALISEIDQVAPTDTTVLITGENGTGKELVATRLFLQSERRTGPLVKVNCPGIPDTLFESQLFGHVKGAFTGAVKDYPGKFVQADGGTLFLDEIGDLPPASQAKLLRALETGEIETLGAEDRRKVDVRLICATNRNLMELVAEQKFREDLFYRISVFEVRVPSLAERPDDIALLVGEFMKRFDPSGETSFSPAALAELSVREYPGNVRQLRNLVERLSILKRGRTIQPEDLSGEYVPSVGADEAGKSLTEQVEAFERSLVKAALESCGGNISETARRLGTDRANLSRKVHDWGLK